MDLSPFRLLPRELRDTIWEAAVCQSGNFVLRIEEDGNIYLLPAASQQNVLALASVCIQLRLESLSLFYSSNNFVLRTVAFGEVILYDHGRAEHNSQCALNAFEATQAVWMSALKTWLARIGRTGVTNIRDLEIDVGRWDLSHPGE